MNIQHSPTEQLKIGKMSWIETMPWELCCQVYMKVYIARVVIREIWNRLWVFCGDYTFGVFDLHPRGIRDIVYDQSKIKMLPPMNTNKFIFIIL